MAKRKSTGTRASRKTGKTAKTAKKGDPLCTFCGKNHKEVKKLIAGPGVYICDECVGLCNDILADTAGQDTSGGWKGWESMTDDELLATLPGGLKSTENVREGLQARIDELRRREVSWARIGDVLNMSRQAAWERFS